MLGHPQADLGAGDQQHDVTGADRCLQGARVGVVDPHRPDAAVGECFDSAEVATAGDDLVGWNSSIEQMLDHQPSELSGSSGDDVRHRDASCVGVNPQAALATQRT
jgi:hypothetical protein